MRARRGRRADSGAVSAEFALLVPLALLFIGFVVALGMRALWMGFAEDSARSLARYGSIRTATGDYPSRPMLVAKSGNLLGGILGTPTLTMTELSSSAITYDQDSSTSPGVGEGDVLSVTVTYRVPGVSILANLVRGIPLIGFDMSGFSTVTETSSARRE